MDSNFVPGLIELRQAKPEDVIDKLHAAFLCIARMDANEVVAAYQTLEAVSWAVGLKDDLAINRFMKAMKNQMVGLAAKDRHLIKRFGEVTHDPYIFDRLFGPKS